MARLGRGARGLSALANLGLAGALVAALGACGSTDTSTAAWQVVPSGELGRTDAAPAGLTPPELSPAGAADATPIALMATASTAATEVTTTTTTITAAPIPTAAETTAAPSTTTLPPDTAAPTTTAPPLDTVAAAPPPPASPTVGDGVVSMAFSGDALWHSPLWKAASENFATRQAAAGFQGPELIGYDFDPMLAELAPVLDPADLAVCHLETPIAPDGEEPSTYPLYGVPREVLVAIKDSGFDRCSTASNHTIDRGVAGVDKTVNELEALGLGVSGMARTPEEIQPRVIEVDGARVSHLSYTYGYNGLAMPAGQEWRSALIDPNRILADAQAARNMGAELVIVSLHWGTEGHAEVSAEQRRIADQLTASGLINLIVGHHAHVLQPIEQVNGVWVIYGLGNMISNMPLSNNSWPPSTQDGAVVTVDFIRQPDGSFTVTQPVVHPTWVDRYNGWIVRLVQPTLANPDIQPVLREQLEASLARTRSVLGPYVPA